jgi:hypothetical protein
MGLMNPPRYKNDIFISYAHLDNQPLSKGEEGWVSLLHERLSLRVSQLLGDKNVRIWRDKKLGGADLFDQAIARSAVKNYITINRRSICKLTMRNSSAAIAMRSAA